MIRKRLFQCFEFLPVNIYETTQPIILKAAIDSFAFDPEKMLDRGSLAMQIGILPNNDTHGFSGSNGFDYWGTSTLASKNGIDVAMSSGAEDRGIGKLMAKDVFVKPLEDLVY